MLGVGFEAVTLVNVLILVAVLYCSQVWLASFGWNVLPVSSVHINLSTCRTAKWCDTPEECNMKSLAVRVSLILTILSCRLVLWDGQVLGSRPLH
jgi:hypothetical protein